MSKLSKVVKEEQEMKLHRKDETVVNFMGGESFKINPLDTMKMVTASSIFGEASYYIIGKNMTVKIPRSAIGETGAVDFEFKWTDSVSGKDDFMNFYSDGSVAPYGRFNYVFTEIPETTLSASERAITAHS